MFTKIHLEKEHLIPNIYKFEVDKIPHHTQRKYRSNQREVFLLVCPVPDVASKSVDDKSCEDKFERDHYRTNGTQKERY